MARRGLNLSEEQVAAHQRRVRSYPELPGAKAAVRESLGKAKTSKYRSKKVVYEGIQFDSQHEAEIWKQLRLQEQAGAISHLQRQVSFPLYVNGARVGTYRADFWFYDRQAEREHILGRLAGRLVVADAKSDFTRKLPAWIRTRKLMLACYGIVVVEM